MGKSCLGDDWSYPRPFVTKITDTQDNSYPRQLIPILVIRYCSYSRQLLLKTIHTQDRSYQNNTDYMQLFWGSLPWLTIEYISFKYLCRELVCITVKWTWYNGRDIFFHITSGRINMWKGVNQLKEQFFLNLIIFFLNTCIYLKLANHRYLMIKNTFFFTIHNKNGVLLSNFKPIWPYP